MPSYKVLKSEDARMLAFDFNPQKFPVLVPESANDFVRTDGQRPSSGFKLNELISAQIGVAESEGKRQEEQVDQLAVERLKEIQEKAYEEAYRIGLEEGKKEAFEAVRSDLLQKMEGLDGLIGKIASLKKDMVSFNEAHIVKAIAFLAGQVAQREIEVQSDSIMPVLVSIMNQSQENENVLIRVSKEDFEFIQNAREELDKQIDNFGNIKFEVDEDIKRGGCMIESNYGTVDATIEQRIEKVLKIFSEKAPTVKEKIG